MNRMNKNNSLHKQVLKEKDFDRLDLDDKDYGLKTDDLHDPKYQVTDEFGQPYKSLPLRISSAFVQHTKTGYYKSSWAVVTGNELYLYPSKDSAKHAEMYILQGAQIKGDTTFEGQIEVNNSMKYTHLYLINIRLGHS